MAPMVVAVLAVLTVWALAPMATRAAGEIAQSQAANPAAPTPGDSAKTPVAKPRGKRSGRPLPRFASLRSSEVNVRTGPGVRYPVEWVFKRRSFPIEIVAEFDTWRKVRDWQGTVGWVHRSMLSGRRTVLVTGLVRRLHSEPAAGAETVARLEPGVVAELLQCEKSWCEIQASGHSGWLRKGEFWGARAADGAKK
ncbi:MAG: SH3 domain-containing protein [Alphaproteobacteria bacterium]